MEISVWFIISIIFIAFFCEYIDSTLGMGYGTTLAPLLIIFGFKPLQIVPVILLSELISGLMAAVFHQKEGNVDLRPKITNYQSVVWGFKWGIPHHLSIAMVLAVCSILGTIVAVFVALNIPKFWLNLYIGVLVFSMGIIMLIMKNKKIKFSWKKITTLGLIASFNNGMSGGGYGPVVTGGQIISGIESKSAVGITSLAEGLTCAVGVLTYLFVSHKPVDWTLAPYIILGAVLSVPCSAKSVRLIDEHKLKLLISGLTLILGSVTILKTFGVL